MALLLGLLAGATFTAVDAPASTLITQNPRGPYVLEVSRDNVARVGYTHLGVRRHLLAWGAINGGLGFRLDYSGGHATGHPAATGFRNACGRYQGGPFPGFELAVRACTMPDGSHWALQVYQRIWPNYGGTRGKPELRLSHWSGAPATLEVWADYSKYGPSPTQRFHHIFGRYTYRGRGIAVGSATSTGVPLDRIGRNLYLDSLNPDYGFPPGTLTWRRVNGFLANRPLGQFCFEIGPKRTAPNRLGRLYSGRSTENRYRLTAVGPGVTPDVRVYFDGPLQPFDAAWEAQMNQLQRDLIGNPALACGDPGGRDG